jgi:hypothetical protein
MMNNLAQSEENTKFAYIKQDDILKLANFNTNKNDFKEKSNEIFLVVKAPKGTTLEVPDIEEN